MGDAAQVFLGTVAIEPQRWAGFVGDSEPAPLIDLAEHIDLILSSGFDGVEVWERHLTEASDESVVAVLDRAESIPIFNTYCSLDDADSAARGAVTDWVRRIGAVGVKFNIGNDPSAASAYSDRIAEWLTELPAKTSLLCECHHGISIAEVPSVAAAIFDAAGSADRLGAIVHLHEDPDHIRERFASYGERIRHVHVNFLDFTNLGAPKLADIRPRLESQVALLQELGFSGSWTIEFTHGVLTENDEVHFLLGQAIEDLGVLRGAI